MWLLKSIKICLIFFIIIKLQYMKYISGNKSRDRVIIFNLLNSQITTTEDNLIKLSFLWILESRTLIIFQETKSGTEWAYLSFQFLKWQQPKIILLNYKSCKYFKTQENVSSQLKFVDSDLNILYYKDPDPTWTRKKTQIFFLWLPKKLCLFYFLIL